MLKVYLNEEQARVGIVAGMWTDKDLEDAKKAPTRHIKDNYFLQYVTSGARGNGDTNHS